MKMILLLLLVTVPGKLLYSQPNVVRATDQYLDVERNGIRSSQLASLRELTGNNYGTWPSSQQTFHGVSYITYVQPGTKRDRYNANYNVIIETAIKLIESYGINNLVDILKTDGGINSPPKLKFIFLSGNPSLSASREWGWDEKDWERVGVLAFTNGIIPLRNIVISNWYQASETENITGQVLHGLAHILHQVSLGETTYWGQNTFYQKDPAAFRTGLSRFTQEQYADNISLAAYPSKNEFVAELFSHTLLYKFKQKVQNEADRNRFITSYRYYLGPPIDFLKF